MSQLEQSYSIIADVTATVSATHQMLHPITKADKGLF